MSDSKRKTPNRLVQLTGLEKTSGKGPHGTSGDEPGPPKIDHPPDPRLVAQGWKRRFMADPVRAQETVELYSSLGFEVRAEPVTLADLSEECGECVLATTAYRMIYTRTKSS